MTPRRVRQCQYKLCPMLSSVPPSQQSSIRLYEHAQNELHTFKPGKNPSFQIPTYSYFVLISTYTSVRLLTVA